MRDPSLCRADAGTESTPQRSFFFLAIGSSGGNIPSHLSPYRTFYKCSGRSLTASDVLSSGFSFVHRGLFVTSPATL